MEKIKEERCEHKDKIFLHTLDFGDYGYDVDVYLCQECKQTVNIYVAGAWNYGDKYN